MHVESWNINSLRAHISALEEHLCRRQPDVLCLQETMVTDSAFPHDRIRAAGYHAITSGQKGKNGVALLLRATFNRSVAERLQPLRPPSLPPDSVFAEARFLACRVGGVVIASVYVPYGRTPNDPQWRQKILFLSALEQWTKQQLSSGSSLVVCGDFNVAPRAQDVTDAELFVGHAWTHIEMRTALQRVFDAGLVDVVATYMPLGGQPTMWDERRFGKGTNCGVRVDLILASTDLAARCCQAGIDVDVRTCQRPSDHVPVWCELIDAVARFSQSYS